MGLDKLITQVASSPSLNQVKLSSDVPEPNISRRRSSQGRIAHTAAPQGDNEKLVTIENIQEGSYVKLANSYVRGILEHKRRGIVNMHEPYVGITGRIVKVDYLDYKCDVSFERNRESTFYFGPELFQLAYASHQNKTNKFLFVMFYYAKYQFTSCFKNCRLKFFILIILK